MKQQTSALLVFFSLTAASATRGGRGAWGFARSLGRPRAYSSVNIMNGSPVGATAPLSPLLQSIRGGSTTSSSTDVLATRTTKPSSSTRRYSTTIRDIFTTTYSPAPDVTSFLDRVQEQTRNGVTVKVSALSSNESKQYFGTSLAKRGIQPIWIEVDNSKGDQQLFLDRVKLDPNYFPPLEAASVCHFASPKKLASFGLLSIMFFLPLSVLLPLKVLTAIPANRAMDTYFQTNSFPLGIVEPGKVARGFVFCSLDDGTKIVNVDLIGSKAGGSLSFIFSTTVPGLAVDYLGKEPSQIGECIALTEEDLKRRLENEPRAVTDAKATKEGDPANLVVVGDFMTLLTAFGSRWDETEVISLQSCIKTARSFIFGSQYRYSPVSALYMYGRSQDFALQRARGSISERLHLRLWLTPATFEGKPVWVGQVSRDIGVRLTSKTWNLTTHKINPNVDEARDYVVTDLRLSGHLDRVAYVKGVGESKEDNPRGNLTGDPFVTNGKRAVIILSPTKTKTSPKLLDWGMY